MTQTYVVRYGRMRFLGECTGLADLDHSRGQQVVIRSDRGTELGEVLCVASDRTAKFLPNPVQGEILRLATAEDREQEVRMSEDRKKFFNTCQELIAKRRLQMDLVDLEIIQGRERVVFYYLAEKRVDFRELVKDLARVLRTRDRDAPDWSARRGQTPGRLRRLRQAGLLQHAPGTDAAGVDENGQDPENNARPREDFGPLRSPQVLPSLRV